MENEGYQGRINHPARANHRIIRMNLGDEKWGFQYSPYAYFNEHCISSTPSMCQWLLARILLRSYWTLLIFSQGILQGQILICQLLVGRS